MKFLMNNKKKEHGSPFCFPWILLLNTNNGGGSFNTPEGELALELWRNVDLKLAEKIGLHVYML